MKELLVGVRTLGVAIAIVPANRLWPKKMILVGMIDLDLQDRPRG